MAVRDLLDSDLAVQVFKTLRLYWFLTIPAVLILRFFNRKIASPLRKYPGPFLASGSRAWKVISTYGGHTETDHILLHEKYGPVVRIAPNELSFSSPFAARDILAAGKGFHKTDFYWVFPPPENPDIFTEIRENVHSAKKRYVSQPYSMANMQQMTGYIEDTQRLLMNKLDAMSETMERHVDLGDFLHFFAFDVLGEIAFSRKFGFLEAGYDLEGAIKTIDDVQWYDGIVGQIPEYDWLFRRNPLWNYLPFVGNHNLLITRMAQEEIEKRNRIGTKELERKDLLSQLFEAHEKAPDTFGEGDVFAVAHGAIFAGSDSTASTMQSFCHHVLREPAIYAKLMSEIDEASEADNLSEMPQWKEAQALPYFQACLKEAMRMRPAVGLNITRVVPQGGAEIDGNWYPEGINVAVNGWVLHRNQSVFGKDAKIFRPERWLGADSKEMEKYMFQFGGGSHLCIGKNLALLEMNKTLPLLFREYDLELLEPEQDLKYRSTFFVVQSGLKVRITKRRRGDRSKSS